MARFICWYCSCGQQFHVSVSWWWAVQHCCLSVHKVKFILGSCNGICGNLDFVFCCLVCGVLGFYGVQWVIFVTFRWQCVSAKRRNIHLTAGVFNLSDNAGQINNFNDARGPLFKYWLLLLIMSLTPTYALKDEFVYYYMILYICKVSNAQRSF